MFRNNTPLRLQDGDKVVIVGGGPAGTTAAMYLRTMKPDLKVMVIDNRDDATMRRGGPGSCKGCVGGLTGFLLDQLATDLNIELRKQIINNTIHKVRFHNLHTPPTDNITSTFEIDIAQDLGTIWQLPCKESVLVSIGNGKVNFHSPKEEPISFDYFMRKQAKLKGVEFIHGFVTSIKVPKNPNDPVLLSYTQHHSRSHVAHHKRDTIEHRLPPPTLPHDSVINISDAALVMNASGMNSHHQMQVSDYVLDKHNKLVTTHRSGRATGKMMAVFGIDCDPDTLKSKFGDTLHIYGGIKGANAIVAAPKYLQKGGSWLTVAILPSHNIPAAYENDAAIDGEVLPKMPGISDQMLAIRDEFLIKSGIASCVEAINIHKPICRCTPLIPDRVSNQPYGNRYVEIGDISGAMKYGRNGIAYATLSGKQAVTVAIQNGITAYDFQLGYDHHFVNKIRRDNILGRFLMDMHGWINNNPYLSRWYYRAAFHSPQLKRYITQILLGIKPADNYMFSTLQLLKETYGGLSLLHAAWRKDR